MSLSWILDLKYSRWVWLDLDPVGVYGCVEAMSMSDLLLVE